MDLGAQRAQLGLARGDLELEGPPLGLARRLEGHDHVVERGGEEVEGDAEAEEERRRLGLLRHEPREDPATVQREGEAAARREPQRPRDDAGQELRAERADDGRAWRGAAWHTQNEASPMKPKSTARGTAKKIASIQPKGAARTRSAASRRPRSAHAAR